MMGDDYLAPFVEYDGNWHGELPRRLSPASNTPPPRPQSPTPPPPRPHTDPLPSPHLERR